MATIRNIGISFAAIVLVGCATTFAPQEGMSLNQVSKEANIPCLTDTKERFYLEKIGVHPEHSEIEIYRVKISSFWKKHIGKSKEEAACLDDLYFFNEKLISELTLKKMLAEKKIELEKKQGLIKAEQDRKDQERRRLEQLRAEMNKFIADNSLTLHPVFTKLFSNGYTPKDQSAFAVYVDQSGNHVFFKNFIVVQSGDQLIADDLQKFRASVIELKLKEDELARQRKFEEQRELERIANERRLLEELERKRREKELILSIARKDGHELIYQSQDFAIMKSKAGKVLYLKNGKYVDKSQAMEEISKYEEYLTNLRLQEEARRLEIERARQQAAIAEERARAYQKEREELRRKNLSYRWVVQAQGANNYCRVEQIRDEGRNEDGGAMFSIAYHCTSRLRPGYAGSSGSTRMVCCFGGGCSNQIRSTNIVAVCN